MRQRINAPFWGAVILVTFSITLAYWEIWLKWVHDLWEDPNYSHGLLVPVISAYIAWRKRDEFKKHLVQPWFPGLLIVFFGALLYVVGGIAGELFTKRVSFLVVFWGVLITSMGPRAVRPFAFPLVYLIFSVPLPYIVYDAIGFPLKLMASASATWVLHLFGFPIYREGNLLYLPNMTLEVVDACSGIRSLMSILALAVVVAWYMHKDVARRVITCLLAIPVVLFTNSMRIVITGVLAVKMPNMASGFFHSFEGELMFLLGVVILVGLSSLMRKRPQGSENAIAKDELKGEETCQATPFNARPGPFFMVIALASILILSGYFVLKSASMVRPVGLLEPLQAFPSHIGDFEEVDATQMPPSIIEVLGVDSYILRSYRHKSGYVLWLYIGYFEDQKEGAMIHSPKHCYPGSGWSPIRADEVNLTVRDARGLNATRTITVNEYLLQKGELHQMVYYWYHSRGRVVANEYVDRFFMIVDSLFRHRSDGALVRISGLVDQDESQKAILKEFIADMFPYLEKFLPN